MHAGGARPVFWGEIRLVLIVAMLVFCYTIGIGILNGTDAVDFDKRRLLGHVHGGTLGWLTLSVFAASLWLFGPASQPSARERSIVRGLTIAAIVAFPAYVAAFTLTYGNWRPALGAVSMVPIIGFTAWVLWRARQMPLAVPHLGFLAALGTSIVGGVLGVLLGLEIASGRNWLPDGGEDAHPATMVVGFLIPVTLAMVEWSFFFPNPPKATRAGQIQMAFPFAGGVILMLSLLLDITPLAPIAILLEIIGIGIFVRRLWPKFRQIRWLKAPAAGHAVLSTIGLAYVLGLAQYFVIKYDGDFNLVPSHQLLSLDHAQFIGASTNAIFALLLVATVSGRPVKTWERLVFLLVNIGIIGFAAALLADATVLKRIFAPIMGTGLLLGLALFAWRLLSETSDEREPRETGRANEAVAGG